MIDTDPVAQAYPVCGVGQVPAELAHAVSLYRAKKPHCVLEIGVWYGGTLREWLRHAQPNATVVAVDIDHVNPAAYEDWRVSDTNLIVLTGDSQDVGIVEQISAHGPYDWVFIDGDHVEDAVQADVSLARTLIRPGGVLLLHDIDAGGSETTGPRNVLERLRADGCRIEEIIKNPAGYPAGAAHGIGIVHL